MKASEKIYNKLNDNGADLGNASIIIIESITNTIEKENEQLKSEHKQLLEALIKHVDNECYSDNCIHNCKICSIYEDVNLIEQITKKKCGIEK